MGSLKSIEAVVPTQKGNVKVSLKREAARFGLSLVSPDKTVAMVGIPVEKGRRIAKVAVNGKTVWQAGKAGKSVRGLVCKGEDDRYCRFEVTPGKWDFSAVYE